MKKPLLIVVIILVVILALPVISLISWTFQGKKPMGVIILDKTVPTLERLNHRSLTWILTNERFVKKNKSSYSYKKDYFGFFPTRPLREKLWTENKLKVMEVFDVIEKNLRFKFSFVKSINLFFLKKINFRQFSKNYLTAKTIRSQMQHYILFDRLLLPFFHQEESVLHLPDLLSF